MATQAEAAALGRLAFEELAGAVGGIANVHQAIAGRAFGASGPGAKPARVVHDAIAGAVYGGLRHAGTLAGRGAEAALSRREVVALSESPRGAAMLGILQGLRGDALAREGNPLAQPMAVRVGGRPVAPERAALAEAFPDATGRLVVFLHGLFETERSWRWGGREPYAARLRRDLGVTGLELRYNTGHRISRNGRSLAELLERLVAAWPVEVERIALVGHSMGGLVARSALHCATQEELAYARLVTHTVSLGSPHGGAPLEELVHVGSAALHALPETRPFGRFLRRRSGGIRDLRRGSLVDEDWDGRDHDALRAAACAEVPLHDGACHHFVAATLTRSPRHPLARVLGDLLVLETSASGRSRARRIAFEEGAGVHVGPASHFALLNHPQVYDHLRRWLAS